MPDLMRLGTVAVVVLALAALQSSSDDRQLAVRLDRLLEVTRQSLERLGLSVPDSGRRPPRRPPWFASRRASELLEVA